MEKIIGVGILFNLVLLAVLFALVTWWITTIIDILKSDFKDKMDKVEKLNEALKTTSSISACLTR